MLSLPKCRISVTARLTKSSQFGRAVGEPQLPGAVGDPAGVQLPRGYRSQQSMNLVEGEHGGGRVVDRR